MYHYVFRKRLFEKITKPAGSSVENRLNRSMGNIFPDCLAYVDSGVTIKITSEERGNRNMPPIFKALVTITVWILFVYGCLGILGGIVLCIMSGAGATVSGSAVVLHPSIGVASLILSSVAAWLRRGLE